MRLPINARDIAPRLATGAFILDSGLGKIKGVDEETARSLHSMATTAYPFLGRIPPDRFVKLLSIAEMSLGAALLLPVVPTAVAGLGLTAFSGGLVGMYLRIPGMRRPGSLAPSTQGLGIAKDSWMLGIGLGFLTEAAVSCCRTCGHRRCCHR